MNFLYNLATDKHRGPVYAPAKLFLFTFSLIYGLIVKILILFYGFFPVRLNCKVISVGNITVGGTGKTVLVEFIASYLKQNGRKVAILSRGYKRSHTVNCEPSTVNYESMGDEPYMLSRSLKDVPVIVDADRARAADMAIEKYGVDTVILDDGFQQWRIKKDLEIVTVDAANPFGNRRLIPRGLLREPLSSLKRADLFILTKIGADCALSGTKDFLKNSNAGAQIFDSAYKPEGFYDINSPNRLFGMELLKSKTVSLVSGIADPASFEGLIGKAGFNIGLTFRFPDHYHYAAEDLNRIIGASKEKNIDAIVTTEKDAARLSSLPVTRYPLPVYVLRIKLEILNDEDAFRNRLLKLYSL